jgi:hypothetical protein
MERRLFLSATLLASLSAHAADSPQTLLAASDAVRNPDKPFAVTVTLIEYRQGRQNDSNTLQVYSKADLRSGQYRSLIRFVAPQRDANKLMLKSGNDLSSTRPARPASGCRRNSGCSARRPTATCSR